MNLSAPRSLTTRLVLTAVALVTAVTLLIAGVTTLIMRDYLIGKLDQQVAGALGPRGDRDAPGMDRGRGDDLRCGPGPRNHTLVLPMSGSGGGVLDDNCDYETLSDKATERVRAVPTDGEAHTVDLGRQGSYRVVIASTPAGEDVALGLPMNDIDDTIGSLLLWSLLLSLFGVVGAGALGTALVRRQLRPLREVAATAHEVTAQDLSLGVPDLTARVPDRLTDPTTEVGQVGSALNTLLQHVDEALLARHASEQQVRQFVADASHELRTPLSTIQGYAELSRRSPDDASMLSGAMTKVETEAGRMAALVEDLLLLARLDAGRPLASAEVDLTHLLLEAVADARVVAPDHQWRLELPDEPVAVVGDELRLHQAITNLLNNARHHTPSGTTVTVALAAGDPTLITIHDNGPGLPETLRGQAFDRFSRGDDSRARTSGGAGLGLSIVSAIAAAHGGSARLDSRPGDTTFTITVPQK